jgi:hypothetical protein
MSSETCSLRTLEVLPLQWSKHCKLAIEVIEWLLLVTFWIAAVIVLLTLLSTGIVWMVAW